MSARQVKDQQGRWVTPTQSVKTCPKGYRRCGRCDSKTGQGVFCRKDLCKLVQGASKAGAVQASGEYLGEAFSALFSMQSAMGWATTWAFGTKPFSSELKKYNAMKLLESYMGVGVFTVSSANKPPDMGKVCVVLLGKLAENQAVCGHGWWPHSNGANTTVLGKLNCEKHNPERQQHCVQKSGKTCGLVYPDKAYKSSDLRAVLDICVTPCMQDTTRTCNTCCMAPQQIAHLFKCCREQGCCPNQQRHRAQTTLSTRETQVSVTVSVAVEENQASVSVYDALLRCLQNPAKLDAMCLTGSSGH